VKAIAIFIPLVLLCSCRTDTIVNTDIQQNTIALLDTVNNPIKVNVGDSWLFRSNIFNRGLRAATGAPDTITAYYFMKAVKDTIINENKFTVIECKSRWIDKDSIIVSFGRSAIHSDSLSVFEIYFPIKGPRTTETVFARAATIASANPDSLMQYFINDSLNIEGAFTPIRFPLKKDSLMPFRSITMKDAEIRMCKYMGQEEIETPLGKKMAWKFTHILPDYYPTGYSITSWVGVDGLLKRQQSPIETSVIDSTGKAISIQTSNIKEYLGKQDIQEDTLIPWGKK